MTAAKPQKKRWFHYRGPWLFMAGPAVVVVASFVTAWIAYHTQDDLVDNNYYQSGQSVNQQLKSNQYAQQNHLTATLHFVAAENRVNVDFASCPNNHCPQALALQLRHPTKTALDQEVVLVLDGDHHYRGVATLPPAHSWYLTLSDTEHRWRIGTVWDTKSAAAINLHPLTSVNPEDQ